MYTCVLQSRMKVYVGFHIHTDANIFECVFFFSCVAEFAFVSAMLRAVFVFAF